jgi:hypothetical protein
MSKFWNNLAKGWISISVFPFKPLKPKRFSRRFKGTDMDRIGMDWRRVGIDIETALEKARNELSNGPKTAKKSSGPSPVIN